MSLRLRSDLRVQSLIRTVQGLGGFALVRHRGHEAAGVIHLVVEESGGLYSVYVEIYGEEDAVWRPRLESVDAEKVDGFFAKERGFDRDLWAVDIEGGIRIGELG